MANFYVTNYDELAAAIVTANTNNNPNTGAPVNDSIYFQNDITLTAEQVLDLDTPDNTGNLRFRGGTPANYPNQGDPAVPINYTLTVVNDLDINDANPETAQPSFTIGPFTLQIGNGGTAGGISGNLRADDGGVLAFNRSVDTLYTGTLSVEQEDNGLINEVAGTTVTLDGSQGTNGLAIRASQGTGAADEYDLEIGGDGDGVISGIIGDGGDPEAPGTITKEGDGTWTLSGANTYLGLTTVSEGVLNIQSATGLGGTGAGTVVGDGGTLALQSTAGIAIDDEALSLAGDGVAENGGGGAGALENVSGNNSFAGAITLAADARINSDAGTLTLTGGIGADEVASAVLALGGDGDGVVDGVITAVTGLVKDGDGTWRLDDANTYGGTTTVAAGTLLVNGSIANSTASVQNGGTLGGSGTLGAVGILSGGTFAAGDGGAGAIATGDLTLASGATFAQEIAGTTEGSFDTTAVTGAVTLGGATLGVSLSEDFAAAIGQSVEILSNDEADAVTGKFASPDGDLLDEGETFVADGRSFQISYVGGTGNDVVLTVVNTAPLANNDTARVLQRDNVAGNVLGNDADTDGGTLAVTAIAAGGAARSVGASTSIAGNFGTLTISGNGAYSYDADGEGAIPVGSALRDTFTYTVSDGQGGTDTAQLQLSVFGSGLGDGGNNTFLMTGPGTIARGLAGNDTYIVNGMSDRVFERDGQGNDTVLSTASYTLGAGQEVETLQLLSSTGTRGLNLTGNAEDQTLIGNAGANKLTGGGGGDTLKGLGGADTFVFRDVSDSKAGGRDLITDFRQAQNDRIDLHLIDANVRTGGNQAFHFIGDDAFGKEAGELQARFTAGGDTLVSGDVNGDGNADFAVLLTGRIALERGDFIL